MKRFLSGLIVGIMLCSVQTLYASVEEFVLTKADYKVVVNNAVYDNAEYPTMTYKGTTYVPLKKLGDLLNVNVSWNPTLNQAEINTKADKPVVDTDLPNTTFFTKDGYDYIKYDDVLYIISPAADDIIGKKNSAYGLRLYGSSWYLVNQITDEILLKDLPLKTINNRRVLEYAYLQNIMLPLVPSK